MALTFGRSNSGQPNSGQPNAEWRPSTGIVVTMWVGAVLAVVWCALLVAAGSDPAGLVLAGCAAVGLLVGGVFGVRARPRLQADADGLTVRGMLRAHHHPWPLVRQVRVTRIRRWGRTVGMLEIDSTTPDGDDRLTVFGRFDLGADPEDVAEELAATRAASGR